MGFDLGGDLFTAFPSISDSEPAKQVVESVIFLHDLDQRIGDLENGVGTGYEVTGNAHGAHQGTFKVSLALEDGCKVRYNRLLGRREYGYPLYINGPSEELLIIESGSITNIFDPPIVIVLPFSS